ncbi:MAG: hypothetical protein M1812_001120 [Candelaria pacifica]|nr:MAG: hypothetical protein M1812_001120 [Candelaria pacifica]
MRTANAFMPTLLLLIPFVFLAGPILGGPLAVMETSKDPDMPSLRFWHRQLLDRASGPSTPKGSSGGSGGASSGSPGSGSKGGSPSSSGSGSPKGSGSGAGSDLTAGTGTVHDTEDSSDYGSADSSSVAGRFGDGKAHLTGVLVFGAVIFALLR